MRGGRTDAHSGFPRSSRSATVASTWRPSIAEGSRFDVQFGPSEHAELVVDDLAPSQVHEPLAVPTVDERATKSTIANTDLELEDRLANIPANDLFW